MAAHRYWRARFDSPKDLSLSEFQLIAGTTRVDAPATLTSNIAPFTGALASLKDDDVATDAAWPLAKVVMLSWDFGSGSSADVSDIRLGSTLSRTGFPPIVALDFSDDAATWTQSDVFGVILWPGFRAKTVSEQLGNLLKARSYGQTNSTTQYVPTSPYLIANGVGDYGTIVLPPSTNTGVRQVEFSKVSINNSGLAADIFGFTTGDGIRNSMSGAGMPVTGSPIGNRTGSIGYSLTGTKYVNGTSSAFGAAYTTGDVIGATVNYATGAITFYKNGVSQGVAGNFTVGQSDIMPMAGVVGSSGSNNTNNYAIRTRGFTYPIAGATPWEDRYRIATHYAMSSSSLMKFAKVETLAARSSFGLKGIKALYRQARDWREQYLGTGRGRVKGTTKDKGSPNVPVSERVRLYQEVDGRLIQEQWSKPGTGDYSFDYVDELQTYTVISYDHDKNFRAVVADRLTLAGGGVEYIGDAPVVAPPQLRVRDIGPNNASGTPGITSLDVPVPTCQAGDLLVALLVFASVPTTTPAGWTLVSNSGLASGSGSTKYGLVYTRVATSSEPTAYTFTFPSTGQGYDGQILSLTSPNGTPVFNVEGHNVVSNTLAYSLAMPNPTPVSPGTRTQIAIGLVGSSLVYTPDTYSPFPGDWTAFTRSQPPSGTGNRMAVAQRAMFGNPITGNTTVTGGSAAAMIATTLIFTDP